MAEQLEQIVLDVKFETNGAQQALNSLNVTIADLKKEQAALKKEIEAGNDATGELSKAYAVNEQQIKLMTASQKALSGQLQTTQSVTEGVGDSFRELDAQCRALENQYKSLTKAQRNSAEGQALRDAIIQQKEALKEFDAELGNHQRNVGNYEGAISKLFPQFGKLQSGLKSIGVDVASMAKKGGSAIGNFKAIAVAGFAAIKGAIIALGKALLANPILALIAAAIALVVAAISKLTAAFKKNDNAMTNLSAAFAIFKPLGTAIGKIFDTLAENLSKVVLALANGVKGLTAFLEKIKLLPAGTAAAVQGAQDLVVAQDELEEAERQYVVSAAKNNKQIAELRDKAAQSNDITERLALLEQARVLEEQNLQAELDIANERLRIAKELAVQNNDTTDETKDNIAQLEAAVENAQANFANGVRRLDTQIRTERNNAIKEEENRHKEALARRKEQLKTERDMVRAHEDLVVAMIEDDAEREYETRKLHGEREIADLQERLLKDNTLTETAREELNATIVLKQQQLVSDLDKIEQAARAKRQQEAEQAAAALEQAEKEAAEKALQDWQAAWDKEHAQRTNDYERRKQQAGSNAIELAKIETDAAVQMYEELLALNESEKEQLYGSQEAYEAAVIESENRITEAHANETQLRMEKAQEWASVGMELAKASVDLANALGNRELANYTKQQDEQRKQLERRLQMGQVSQAQYDQAIERMDKELERKQAETQLKAAKRQKAIAIMETIINTAAGIAKAVSENPMFGGLPGSAIAATMGALQLATIIAEPLPTAGKGKLLVGKSHAQGGIPIEAEGGEAIINKRSTKMFKPLLSAINQAGGGVRFASGGLVGEQNFEGLMANYSGNNYETMRAAMSEAVREMPSPVMVYEEFTQFSNNVVKQQEFASI